MADDELETGSAAVSEIQDAPVDDVADTGAESSPEPKKDGEKFDLLSVVRSAVAEKADPASPAGQEVTQPEADTSAQKPEKALDNEDFSDAPFHNHPRFKQLVAQRNQYREGAKQYEQIQTFLADNGLTPEEAADALVLQALMKSNPAEAWKQMKPRVQQLLADAGEILPADLKARVQRGEMSQAAAVEFNRLRAMQASGEKSRAMQAEIAQRRAEQERQASITQAVATWEQSTQLRDPDFPKLTEALHKEVLWLQKRDGMPKTAEEARKMVETAYAAVKKTAAPRVQKPAVAPVTGGRVASGKSTGKPQSMLDIVRMNRSQG